MCNQYEIEELKVNIRWIEAKDFLTNRDYVLLADLEDRLDYLQQQLNHRSSTTTTTTINH